MYMKSSEKMIAKQAIYWRGKKGKEGKDKLRKLWISPWQRVFHVRTHAAELDHERHP
jgi:hypothetical protein